MATVTLRGVYLARVSNLADLLVLNAGVTVAGVESKRGEFRTYAGGRVRLITKAGRGRTVQVSAAHTDRPTRERLNAWAGELLLLRDGRGRKMYGSYLELAAADQPGPGLCTVTFAFVAVDLPEAA